MHTNDVLCVCWCNVLRAGTAVCPSQRVYSHVVLLDAVCLSLRRGYIRSCVSRLWSCCLLPVCFDCLLSFHTTARWKDYMFPDVSCCKLPLLVSRDSVNAQSRINFLLWVFVPYALQYSIALGCHVIMTLYTTTLGLSCCYNFYHCTVYPCPPLFS